MNRLIIFDLDGVLFESRDMHFETLNGALEHYRHRPITRDEHETCFNGLPTRVKLEKLHITGEDAERISKEKQGRTLGWVLLNVKRNDDLVSLFTDLRTRGWKIAVASNAITVTVVRSLSLLGLWELCDFVTAGDRVVFPKPDPMMYFNCMSVCGADISTTWIVEDSPLGIEAAQASGAHVISVGGPDNVVTAVREVMEAA